MVGSVVESFFIINNHVDLKRRVRFKIFFKEEVVAAKVFFRVCEKRYRLTFIVD